MDHEYVYEVVDRTSDEVYFPLGIYLDFEQAKKELMEEARKNCRVSDFSDGDDWERLVIQKRRLGWGDDTGVDVFVVEREWKYIESEDDNRWVIISIRDKV